MSPVAASSPPGRVYYSTTSLCPTCGQLVPGQVVGGDDGVFVERDCPRHGPFRGLICSDTRWWDWLPRFDVEPVKPKNALAPVARGCPSDCGLCAAHRQIAGTAAIEISNRCNANCPACLADNRKTFELTPDEVRGCVQALLRAQGHVDALALSGGEPTIHPRLFEIIEEVERFPSVARIALNTNGLRIAEDDAFLDELKKHPRVYVSLHFDGPGARQLRGIPFAVQQRALERLESWGIDAIPLVLAAQGVNDHELGLLCQTLLARPGVRSVIVSMLTFAGANGSRFPGDAQTRLTIPGALDAMERGSAGALRRRDFIPLPMPNPMCAAIGYYLVEGETFTALVPLGELEEVIEATKNANFADVERLSSFLRNAIDRLWAQVDRTPEHDRVLASFRALLGRLYPVSGTTSEHDRLRVVEQHIKTVYLLQLMDAWSFDSRRLAKCSCQHLFPDGSIIPSCGYYAYHRRFDERFGGPAPAAPVGL
jgi:7,8-dihydro-6-hydroxymethylpterin dimethyltransferase